MTRTVASLSACLIIAALTPPLSAQRRDAGAETIFATHVLPVLRTKCLACHGDDVKKLMGGLDLRSRDAVLRGGDRGPAVVPGKPGESPLFLAVTRGDAAFAPMPPKEADRLAKADIDAIREWIAGGAPWPGERRVAEIVRAQKPVGVAVRTSGGLSAEWTNRLYHPADLWAYQPLRRPQVPEAGGHLIDAFLRARLEAAGFVPAGAADRRTLLRRVTMDLTGLPPTPAEAEAFVKSATPRAAYEAVVNRLLASPHYAEQQARHWLDVARYADTAGFSNDFERPNAWRYRDYVVRAFRHDKPFDRFVLEQIAGDELAPEDPEALVAVGFLRMGPWEHTGMTVAAVTRQQWLDDVTNAVGVTFLGQGLRCAACHDHKFDPVPTRDYYRIQAAFATTYLAERPVPFLPAENLEGATASRDLVEARLKEVVGKRAGLQAKAARLLERLLKEKGVGRIEDLPPGERPKRDYLGTSYGLDQVEITLRKVYSKSKDYFDRELLRYEPYALSVYTGADNGYLSPRPLNPVPKKAGQLAATHILKGGALESPGEEVGPGVLSAVALSADPTAATMLPATPEGRRLALARWIVGEGKALTARVIVNRLWQQHFGTGLVATPNNFGKMGARPSHPELLDWLAGRFIDKGWSVKKLHRLIVTSAAYQQAGSHPEIRKLQAADPRNQWLAYFPSRWLAAEEIRDGMLLASGELNPPAGGPGFFPEINWEVALQPRHVMGSVAPAYLPSLTRAERNRRTLYAARIRTLADPMLEVFNRPGSDLSCERRDETIVASQAFALFNGTFAHARALALADRVKGEVAKEQRVAEVFRRVLGRLPNEDERRWSAEHVARMTEHHGKHPPPKTAPPTKVRRQFVEELVGELVSWDEELTPLRRYEPDLQPWQVPAETRALAELALVLMNSNEFLSLR